MWLQFYTATVAYINRKKVSLEIRVCVSGDTFIHPHENDNRACVHRAYITRTIVGWPYASDRNDQPTNQPTKALLLRGGTVQFARARA